MLARQLALGKLTQLTHRWYQN